MVASGSQRGRGSDPSWAAMQQRFTLSVGGREFSVVVVSSAARWLAVSLGDLIVIRGTGNPELDRRFAESIARRNPPETQQKYN